MMMIVTAATGTIHHREYAAGSQSVLGPYGGCKPVAATIAQLSAR